MAIKPMAKVVVIRLDFFNPVPESNLTASEISSFQIILYDWFKKCNLRSYVNFLRSDYPTNGWNE